MAGIGHHVPDRPMFEDMYGNKYEDYYFTGNGFIVITEKGDVYHTGETADPLGDVGDYLEGWDWGF